MKRLFLALSISLCLVISNIVYAVDNNLATANINNRQIIITTEPIIEKGSVLVPAKTIFEPLGYKLYWYNKTKSVTIRKGQAKAKIYIGKTYAYINGKRINLNVKPKIVQGYTYVSLDFVNKFLQKELYWEDNTKTITEKNKNIEEGINLVDSQKYQMRTIYRFINKGDTVNSEFTVPMGAISDSPYQKDDEMNITPTPVNIFEEDNNKYAQIKVNNIQKGQETDIIITQTLTNSGITYPVNRKFSLKDYENFKDYEKYTKPEPLIESDNQQIINKAMELSKGEKDSYIIAKKVYEYVNLNLKYNEDPQYARKGAVAALNSGMGVCEDFSKLFVALLRANNIPARTVKGFWISDKEKDKVNYNYWYNIEDSLLHEWPEFYLSDIGWVIAEPTYTFTYGGVKTVPWDQFANQKSNGHIICGYGTNINNNIAWKIGGYGALNVDLIETKREIRKTQ